MTSSKNLIWPRPTRKWGDNDGAREILQEVLKEGDNEQKDQAQKLIGTLG